MMIYGLSANMAGGEGNGTKLPEQGMGLLEAFGKYAGENPVVLISAGVLAVGIIAAVILLVRFRSKRERGKGESVMPVVSGSMERVEAVRIGKLHEQGERSGQQDCFGVSDESLMQTHGLLVVVADGMGGLSDGDKVSEVAVRAALDYFTMYQGKCTPEQLLLMLAKQAVEGVNGFLGASGLHKSGSTMVMGLVKEGAFSFLSIGDSRICLYRHGILMQLNREHTYKAKLALDAVNGELPLQEVYTDSRRSGLISFLGMGALAYLDMPEEPLKLVAGDKLLLMSDGVYNALEEGELTECLDGDVEEAVERLQKAIREKGYTNQDNYTAVIVECGGRRDGTSAAAQVPHTENPD